MQRARRPWRGIGRVAILLPALVVVALAGAGRPAAAADPSACEPDGVQPGGAIYRICMPATMPWNGHLVVWAHGYVEPGRPVGIPEEQLCLGGSTFCIPAVANALGFAFITTSYSMNGLVTTGPQDVAELIDIFTTAHGEPKKTYLVGASEGGLVTALAVEQRPDLFAGGLAACGPIGDFRSQVNYYGDFRVLFDYFFPDLIPGSPVSIPDDVIANWDAYWNDKIKPVVFDPANSSLLMQLLMTAHAPYMPSDPTTIETTVHDALWYNVFATNDVIMKLAGQPFDNLTRTYMGSSDDAALNAQVERFAADPMALTSIDTFLQTSGSLQAPLVSLHTWMDQQVAFGQEFMYWAKVNSKQSMKQWVLIPVLRYGHCNFMAWEALLSFAIVFFKANATMPANIETLLPDAASRAAFTKAARQAGILGPGRHNARIKVHSGRSGQR